jgi:KUP system potassium uptake protein
MKLDRIEESSVRLLGSSSVGSSESKWVDGSEVDWDEDPPWSNKSNGSDGREGYGSIRRRLVKKPKRVDSFDVEAMEIAASHDQHSKVCMFLYFYI